MKTNNSKLFRLVRAALILAVLILLPIITPNTYYRMLYNQVLVNAVIVMGLNYITGLTGQMNLATGGIMALGAYGFSILSTKAGLSPWLGILFALVLGVVIGFGLGYPSLRVSGVYLSLTTIGFGEVVRIVLLNWRTLTGGATGVRSIPRPSFLGLSLSSINGYYYFLLAIVVLLYILAKRIAVSKWGRAFKSIRDNASAAQACGINIAFVKILAFTLAAVYGCLGGALYAGLMGFIAPGTFTQDLSVNYLVMMTIGGLGSFEGSLLGAAVVTMVPELLRFMEDYYWLIFSIITLLFAIFLPHGLVSVFKSTDFWMRRQQLRRRRNSEAKGGKQA